MTPFRALMKVVLHENFALKRMLGGSASKSKKMTGFIVISILYAIGVFLASFGYLFYELGTALDSAGMIDVLLMFAFFYGSSISVMLTLFRANGNLFKFRDYEFLAPLPLRATEIVAAKVIVMMINQYLTILLFTSPIMFAYFAMVDFNLLGTIWYAVGFFFVPLIPVAVCSFVSMLIARFTSRFRKSNLVTIFLMFLVFIGLMVASLYSSLTTEINPLVGQVDFIESLGQGYWPMTWFTRAVGNGDGLSLLFLVISGAVPFSGFVFLLGKLVMNTNAATSVTITSSIKKPVVYEETSLYPALVTKEFRMFFNTPIYALNSGFGPLILILASIASLFFKNEVLNFLQQMTAVGLATELLLLVFVGFCISMVYTSAVSLSLEGKQFWILRSMPIRPETILRSKLIFNVLLGLPAAVVGLVLLAVAFEIPTIGLLVMIFAAASLSVLTSVLGSIINLYLPKFDFMNEAEVVKQSAAALVAVFGSFLILVADGFMYYGWATILPMEWSLVLVAGTNLILSFAAWKWMAWATENLFRKLVS